MHLRKLVSPFFSPYLFKDWFEFPAHGCQWHKSADFRRLHVVHHLQDLPACAFYFNLDAILHGAHLQQALVPRQGLSMFSPLLQVRDVLECLHQTSNEQLKLQAEKMLLESFSGSRQDPKLTTWKIRKPKSCVIHEDCASIMVHYLVLQRGKVTTFEQYMHWQGRMISSVHPLPLQRILRKSLKKC